MKRFLSLIALILIFACSSTAFADEILLHDGPTVSSPDAILYSPLDGKQQSEKDLMFKYQFFIEAAALNQLPAEAINDNPPTLSAIKAVELASFSIHPAIQSPFVTRLELLKFQSKPHKAIDYYFITVRDGAAEIHRIVLMNGSVIHSRMKRID